MIDNVGLCGFEPQTSRLSGVRSNQLSYRPNVKTFKSENKIVCKIKTKSKNPYYKINLFRKEVIQPHLPVRLPCYDLAPVIGFTLGAY